MSCCQRLILADRVVENDDDTFQEIEILYSGDLIAVEQAATVNGFGIINPSAIGTITVLKTKCTYCRALGTKFDAYIDTGFSRQRVTLTYKSEDSNGYTYDVTSTSWQDKAKEIRLWDLMTFEPYIHSEQTIQDSQTSNDYKYSENNTNGGTDKGYWFPHIFFGGLHKKIGTDFSHSQLDFRPTIARRKLLEDAFCAIGLNYESFAQQQIWDGRDFDYLAGENCGSLNGKFTFLNLDVRTCTTGPFNFYSYESYQVRQIEDYIIPKWMPTVKVNPKLAFFKARVSADQVRSNELRCIDAFTGFPTHRAYFDTESTINFDQQIEDSAEALNGGFWGNAYYNGGGYTGVNGYNINTLQNTQGEWELKFKLIIQAPISIPFVFKIKTLISTSTPIEFIQSELVQTHEFTVNFKFLNNWDTPPLNQEWSLIQFQIIPKVWPLNFTVKAGSEISGRQLVAYIGGLPLISNPLNVPTFQYDVLSRPDTNTIIFPQSYIDENLTLYDYIGGIAHQLNGFVTQDAARGTLSLEPQHPLFWTDVETQLSELIEGEYKVGTPDIDFSKTCDVNRFIDSKDAKGGLLIGYKKGGTNAYAKGFGDRYAAAIFGDVNDLQENRNPFYSPAYDREYIETRPSGELAIFVPALLDNEKGESLSTALAYFSLYNYGRITQWESDQSGTAIPRLLRRWIGGGVFDTNAVAYASHIPLAKRTFLVLGVPQFEQYQPLLSYGDVPSNIYETNRLYRFHETDTGAATYSGDFNLKLSEYTMLDFTKRYIISDGCNTVAVRLAKKGGFNCDTNMASLEFRDIIKCNFLNYDFRRQ